MSNKDYTRFSNRRTEVRVKEDPTSDVETVEVIEQTVIEPEPEPKAVEAELREGVIVDCLFVAIREAPYQGAPVVTEVNPNVKLLIDDEKSTEDFYKVHTYAGVEGYCMKRYVHLMP